MYELGIIGGMGPEATAELFHRIIKYTEAKCDQDHISICILNITDTPDRTAAILDDGLSPVSHLNRAICDLIKLRVKRFIICCNTVHYYTPALIKSDKIEFINMVSETINYIKSKEKRKVIIIGTEGTVLAGVYGGALNNAGIKELKIQTNDQKRISEIIYGIKSTGVLQIYGDALAGVMAEVAKTFPDAPFLLACTELSLLKQYLNTEFSIIDPLDIVAIKAIRLSGCKIRPEYENLII